MVFSGNILRLKKKIKKIKKCAFTFAEIRKKKFLTNKAQIKRGEVQWWKWSKEELVKYAIVIIYNSNSIWQFDE